MDINKPFSSIPDNAHDIKFYYIKAVTMRFTNEGEMTEVPIISSENDLSLGMVKRTCQDIAENK